MNRSYVLLILIFFSFNLFASEITVLDKKVIDYGALNQVKNNAANEVIRFKRTEKTPKYVTLKYKVNYLKKECVEAKIKYKNIAEKKLKRCEANGDKTFTCEDVTFESFEIPKRVCLKKGYALKTTSKKILLSFRTAIKLAKGADEVIEINLKQKAMDSKSVKPSGKVIESDALYKVRNWFNKYLVFRAK